MKLKFKILDPRIGKDFQIPKYQTSGSAGLDLIACIDTQMVLTPINKMELEETNELPETIRGEGGFGSTGK